MNFLASRARQRSLVAEKVGFYHVDQICVGIKRKARLDPQDSPITRNRRGVRVLHELVDLNVVWPRCEILKTPLIDDPIECVPDLYDCDGRRNPPTIENVLKI